MALSSFQLRVAPEFRRARIRFDQDLPGVTERPIIGLLPAGDRESVVTCPIQQAFGKLGPLLPSAGGEFSAFMDPDNSAADNQLDQAIIAVHGGERTGRTTPAARRQANE